MTTGRNEPIVYDPLDYGNGPTTRLVANHYRSMAESLAHTEEALQVLRNQTNTMNTRAALAWVSKAGHVSATLKAASESYERISKVLNSWATQIEESQEAAERIARRGAGASADRAHYWEQYLIAQSRFKDARLLAQSQGTEPANYADLQDQVLIMKGRFDTAVADHAIAHRDFEANREEYERAGHAVARDCQEVIHTDRLGIGVLDAGERFRAKNAIARSDERSLRFSTASSAVSKVPVVGTVVGLALGGIAAVFDADSAKNNIELLRLGEGSVSDTAWASFGAITFGVGSGGKAVSRRVTNRLLDARKDGFKKTLKDPRTLFRDEPFKTPDDLYRKALSPRRKKLLNAAEKADHYGGIGGEVALANASMSHAAKKMEIDRLPRKFLINLNALPQAPDRKPIKVKRPLNRLPLTTWPPKNELQPPPLLRRRRGRLERQLLEPHEPH